MGVKEAAIILDLVRDLKEQGEVSVIIIAHNYGQVLEVCDRVNLLQQGQITFDKKSSETSVVELNQPRRRRVPRGAGGTPPQCMRPPHRLRKSGRAAGGSPTDARSSTSTSHPGPGARKCATRGTSATRPPRPPDRDSELRWDPLVGEWVVIAAQRQGRTFLPPADQCPLCPSRPGTANRDTSGQL
jgi:hypothetical protein